LRILYGKPLPPPGNTRPFVSHGTNSRLVPAPKYNLLDIASHSKLKEVVRFSSPCLSSASPWSRQGRASSQAKQRKAEHQILQQGKARLIGRKARLIGRQARQGKGRQRKAKKAKEGKEGKGRQRKARKAKEGKEAKEAKEGKGRQRKAKEGKA